MPLKAPPPRVESFTWTGSYVGGFGGGAWSHLESFNADPTSTTFSLGFRYPDQDATSWILGVTSGYNLQFNQFVIGIESTYAGTHLRDTETVLGDVLPNGPNRSVDRKATIGWIGTTTGRLGLAFDKFLVYGKGGWAWANLDVASTTLNTTNGLFTTSRVGSKWMDGWTAGVGGEWALTNVISLKLEYDYINLGGKVVSSTAVSCNGVVACGITPVGDVTFANYKGNIQMVVVGINAHFNWLGGGNVVAKY
jgi:outer membrane immunogenic protein